MEFSRHAIKLKDGTGIGEGLQALADQGLVGVSIACTPEGKSLPISQESWDAILAGAAGCLYVEALPHREFRTRVRDDLRQVIELSLGLRAKLRSEYVRSVEGEVRDFLERAEGTLSLIGCSLLQARNPEAATNVQKVQQGLKMLSESCYELCDNVLCMDELQYQILPAFKLLQKTFRK